jgi:hypothetical protein
MTKNQKNHDAISDEELFHIEGESQFILAGKVVCVSTDSAKNLTWIKMIIKWVWRS